MNVLGFDPGKRSAAWALARDGKIVGCGMVRWDDGEFPLELGPAPEPVFAIIELPQVYQSTVDPKACVDVGVTAGRIAQALGPTAKVRLVWPHDWKGSVKKEVMGARIVGKLDADEIQALAAAGVPKGLLHNVVDAIGVAKWGSKWGPKAWEKIA